MAVVQGCLSHGTQERNGRLSGRVHVSKEKVGKGRAAHSAGMEAVQEAVHIGKVALDGERTARHDDSHHRLAGSLQGGQQFALGALQVEVGQGMGFAGENRFFSQERQHHVGAAGGSDDIGKTAALLTAELEAGNIVNLAGETLPQRLERRNGVRLFAVEGPGAQLVVRGIGQGTGNEDAKALPERQHAVVLEEDGRLFHGFLGRCKMRGSILHGGSGIHVHVGVIEQAQHHLHAEDVAHSLVDGLLFHGTAFHQLFQVGEETIGHHVHVHAGIHGFLGHVLAVFAEPVVDHLSHGVPVGDHQAVKAPLAAEHVLHHEGVTRGGNAVVVVEGSHQRHGTGLYGCLKGRQIGVAQLTLGVEGAVVVAAAFGCAVTHKMLDAGSH